MKIYAICVLKNEADVIEYSLRHAVTWADKVIVFDNGSTDETWEKVVSISNEKIVAFKQEACPYSDGLRADIFNAFRNELEDGDWWVIQDADEIYDESPRKFIERQSGYFHHINGKKIDFSFDLHQIETIQFANDFSKDVNLFEYYTPIAWSEPRAIKHRKKLEWKREGVWPNHMGLVCENAINIRHYPLRSRDQIRRRWETRKDANTLGVELFSHWRKDDFKEYYLGKAANQKKVEEGQNVFESVSFAYDYRQNFVKRLAKIILHRTGILP